ncbi:MAG: hypothetical protein HY715_09555 [Planctomycetes bacterium]|nr:hypothetical protein [Planctomycetota bacterium]
MLASNKRLLLLGIVAIGFVIVYFWVRPKWSDVNIMHYDGKISAGQSFGSIVPTGIEKYTKRRAGANFVHDPKRLKHGPPSVKAYLNGDILITHKEDGQDKDVRQWKLRGNLDGNMRDIIPGGGKVIEGNSYSVKDWTVEWWRDPKDPVEVVIITNPEGKSRTFRIEWCP